MLADAHAGNDGLLWVIVCLMCGQRPEASKCPSSCCYRSTARLPELLQRLYLLETPNRNCTSRQKRKAEP